MRKPKGKLILIGGSEAKEEVDKAASSELRQPRFFESGILAEFVKELPNKDACIELITAASEIPRQMEESYQEAFSRLGCSRVRAMRIDSQQEADKSHYVQRIEKTDGILFTGGNQTALISKLLDTQLLVAIQQRYQNSHLVIAGSSAGATAMSKLAIKDGKSAESLIKGMVETEKGLSLLPDVIIDTHFMQRSRFPRLTEALLRNPGLLGIGLCTDSGVVIKSGDILRAIGSGSVFIIDTKPVTQTNYSVVDELESVYVSSLSVHVLAKGASYSLKNRLVVPEKEKNG